MATSDYGLLCPDGRVLDIDTTEQCRWATRPWTSWLTRSNAELVFLAKKILLLSILYMC